MRNCFFSMVCVSLAASGLATSASLPMGRREPLAGRCAGEISIMRGVWRSGQVFLPAYGDMELVSYMASLGPREPGVAVIPVLTSEPIYFRSKNVVFLSTGFILKAGSEKELTEAIRTARVEVKTRELPGCAAMAPSVPSSFPDIHLRLAEQLAGYEDVTVRRLRSRDTAAQ
jgi:hypothetical protein